MINIEKKEFGMYKGEKVYKYELKGENGFQVNILNLGGIITEIFVKNKEEKVKNVVLGYDNIEKYIDNKAYPGSVIGRTAGRTANASFYIDGTEYKLDKNSGKNSIHGGNQGFHTKIFNVKELENGIELSYTSPDGEEGYPGNLEFKIFYLLNKNRLTLKYEAISDKKTYVNPTNHSYFNLAGNTERNGDEQILKIEADNVCELADDSVPTGRFINVENTAFDLRKGIVIKKGIEKGHSQFEITRAYDHPFVLNSVEKEKPQITLFSEYSGIEMKVYTTENTAVVYTGNYLDDMPLFTGENDGNKNNRYLGVAIETQDFPNGINEKNFKTSPLNPGEKYHSKTVYEFNVAR